MTTNDASDDHEGLVKLTHDDSDPYSFHGDADDDGLCVTQHRFYRWGDDCIIAIGELNWPNHWDGEAFDAKCAVLEAALSTPKPATSEDGHWIAIEDRDASIPLLVGCWVETDDQPPRWSAWTSYPGEGLGCDATWGDPPTHSSRCRPRLLSQP